MIDAESCRQYAADCLRQAEGEDAPEDKNILLNVALAWVRLAQQTKAFDVTGSPDRPPAIEHAIEQALERELAHTSH